MEIDRPSIVTFTHMRNRTLLLGAVAYDPKVVTIWEGFKAWFNKRDLAFDYILYSNYERQVEAHLAGQFHIAWNSPLAWVRAARMARVAGRRAEAVAMRDTDQNLTSVIVIRSDSPIKSVAEFKGRKIGMSPPGSATHAIAMAILEHNFGLKSGSYSVAPGNESRLAQFLIQKEIDAASIRSVTIAQMQETKLRRLASVVDEWKKLTKSNAAPILAVTIVHSDYVTKNPEAVARFIAATRKGLEFGSQNKAKVAEILQKAANMKPDDAKAYAEQWDGAYMASFEPADIASLKRMHEILLAGGTAKKPVPDSAFLAEPYQHSKKIK